MRYEGGLRYGVLGLVSRHERGIHGWELKKQFEKLLGNFWQVNFGEVYRVLDSLAANGLIEQVLEQQGSSRKLYRITEKGRRSLDDFVLSPATDVPRPLRQELAVKLLFAGSEQMPDLLALIDQQRAAYLQQLGQLEIQRRKLRQAPVDGFVTHLLIDGGELSVRAELAWLDTVAEKLKGRFTEVA
jgi:DNA-binding PadR family transcriptional regulator